MKKYILTLIVAFAFFVSSIAPIYSQETGEMAEATVIDIVEDSLIIEPDGRSTPFQKLKLMGTSGSIKGKSLTVENGAQSQIAVQKYKNGDKVMLSLTPTKDGTKAIITDYVRRDPLLLLTVIFVVLTIVIGGKRGASAILGMGITFALLFLFVLPQLAKGADPLLITGSAIIVAVPVTFFLSHGINKKTISAIVGTFIALIFAAVISQVFIEASHLTGFASEEAGFLDTIKKGSLNIKGLLFAGIIIALLGILEDITISQSAIVFQLKEAGKKLDALELFKRAMNVGKDHIASMANTLILVYAGASLPLLLLFIDSPLSLSHVVNSEFLAEEIVRTLVASIALIVAVPITTLIASIMAMQLKDKGN